jgi:hypothetical protein
MTSVSLMVTTKEKSTIDGQKVKVKNQSIPQILHSHREIAKERNPLQNTR